MNTIKSMLIATALMAAVCLSAFAAPADVVITIYSTRAVDPQGHTVTQTIEKGIDRNGVVFQTSYVTGYQTLGTTHSYRVYRPDHTSTYVDKVAKLMIDADDKDFEGYWRNSANRCALNAKGQIDVFIGEEMLLGLKTYHWRGQINGGGTRDAWFWGEGRCMPIKSVEQYEGQQPVGITPVSVTMGGAERYTMLPHDAEKLTDIKELMRRQLKKAYGDGYMDKASACLRNSVQESKAPPKK